jgi:hypothetical protein
VQRPTLYALGPTRLVARANVNGPRDGFRQPTEPGPSSGSMEVSSPDVLEATGADLQLRFLKERFKNGSLGSCTNPDRLAILSYDSLVVRERKKRTNEQFNESLALVVENVPPPAPRSRTVLMLAKGLS